MLILIVCLSISDNVQDNEMRSIFDKLSTNVLVAWVLKWYGCIPFLQGMEKKWGTRSKGIDVENEYVALHVLYSF